MSVAGQKRMAGLPGRGVALTTGAALHAFVTRLYPICRSITGDGVRGTLAAIGEHIDLHTHEVPTGTALFDWTVPREWNIRGASIRDPTGACIVDFAQHNLHVVNYSVPVQRRLSLAELRPHLHSLPDQPDLIPYRTSYYRDDWGFCLPHRQLEALPDGDYDVCIDSTLKDGALTLGECVLPGRRTEEVLLSAHVCHPALANDNLSAVAVLTALGEWLAQRDREYTYRLVFAPGTIGALAWLWLHGSERARIRAGLVLCGLGDGGALHYKSSRHGATLIDCAARVALRDHGQPWRQLPFSPLGYDERQYGAPGFDLPVGRFGRTPWGEYPEYHTSADNPAFVEPAQLEDALAALQRVVLALEYNRTWRNIAPFGEPQLGRRGLMHGASSDHAALLWLLNLADGAHDLLAIAERSGCALDTLHAEAARAAAQGLLVAVDNPASTADACAHTSMESP